MKKMLLAFLAGILCCIVAMVLLIANVLLNKQNDNAQTPAHSPAHTSQAGELSQGTYIITEPSNVESIQHTPTVEILPNKPEPSLAIGELSAVHGRGGRGHLRAVPRQFTKKEEWVHQDVYNPLMAMIKHAEQDGIRLSVVSAYRSYDHQKRIWENKWGNADNTDTQKALSVLRYSSFPGTSRHHWGTDIDFNNLSPSYWQSGEGAKIHRWLTKNAPAYGFCQTYGYHRSGGYAQEDWHWSHMPTANQYYKQINNPQVLAVAINQPVKGAAAIRQLDKHLYEYIQGISPCNVDNYRGGAVSLDFVAPTQNTTNRTNFNNTTTSTDDNAKLAKSLPKKPQQPKKSNTEQPAPPPIITQTHSATGNFVGSNQGVALDPIYNSNPPPQPNINNTNSNKGIDICSGENCTLSNVNP